MSFHFAFCYVPWAPPKRGIIDSMRDTLDMDMWAVHACTFQAEAAKTGAPNQSQCRSLGGDLSQPLGPR